MKCLITNIFLFIYLKIYFICTVKYFYLRTIIAQVNSGTKNYPEKLKYNLCVYISGVR